MRATLLLAVIITFGGIAFAQDKYEEKCTIATGNGISVDSCDDKKFLSCQTGYCKCNNPVTQLYDYHNVEQTSRSKRSPKKGGSKGGGFKKGVGTGAIVGGAVGAYGGYQVGKAVANAGNGNGGSSSFGSRSSGKNWKKEYACYGRVGSQCVISHNNVKIVSLDATTTTAAPATNAPANETTTTPASSDVTTTSANSTESTSSTNAPVSPSASPLIDINKIPKCVRNAVCQRPTVVSNSNSTEIGTGTDRHVVKVDGDPRLGVCVCASGYEATKRDECVKKSGASNLSLGFSVIFFAVVSKLLN